MEQKSRADEIREFILKSVSDHPSDLSRVVREKFGVTQATVSRHIITLVKKKKLTKTGVKKGARYYLPEVLCKELEFYISERPEEDRVWSEHLKLTLMASMKI